MTKKIIAIALASVLAVSLMGCTGTGNSVDSTEAVEESIPSDLALGYEGDTLAKDKKYIVKDVREAIGGNNVHSYYEVTLLLEDTTGKRVSAAYRSIGKRNDNYYRLALLSSGDIVTYQGSYDFVRSTDGVE